jgi:hypothetical protein
MERFPKAPRHSRESGNLCFSCAKVPGANGDSRFRGNDAVAGTIEIPNSGTPYMRIPTKGSFEP